MSYRVFSSSGVLLFGVLGAVLIGVGHGFVSAKMFFILSLIYNYTRSRNLFFLKGSLRSLGFLIFFRALCLIMKSSAPLSLGFFGELFMFISGSSVMGL